MLRPTGAAIRKRKSLKKCLLPSFRDNYVLGGLILVAISNVLIGIALALAIALFLLALWPVIAGLI